jgi:hypothetical protein
MLLSSPPPSFPIPFANAAAGAFIRPIPVASQIGVQDGAASLTDGFVPDNFTPLGAGGVPPFGQDMNGLLKQITQWCQWVEAGGSISYDATFATGSGGYPKYAIVMSNVVPGDFWMSTADNNTTDPDSVSAANWVPDPGRISPGTPVPSFSSTVPTGFVAANTLTVGNAASNAMGRANADALLAFRSIWLRFSNTACPIYDSTQTPTTRGANPDADFAANKALATPDMRGRGVVGVDTMGNLVAPTVRLSGVPIILGNATTPGSFLGENLHVLVTGELAAHSHANSLTDPTHQHGMLAPVTTVNAASGGLAVSAQNTATATSFAATGITINNASSGSNAAHNTVSQNLTVFWNIKL